MNYSRRQFVIAGAVLGVSSFAVFKILDQLSQKSLLLDKASNDFTPHKTGHAFFHRHLEAKAISVQGEMMHDGRPVPKLHDGMACFASSNGGHILTRNHELEINGGVTLVELDSKLNLVDHRWALIGTSTNCSGGATPWGTWLSCEEVVSHNHGYVYEVNPYERKMQSRRPLVAMGHFQHEAVAAGPLTGYLYMTEDRGDGCLYRFKPAAPGNLERGGKLQALKIGVDGQCSWLNVEEPNPEDDTVRYSMHAKGATPFSRGEGIATNDDRIYFTASTGGKNQLGQIYELTDSANDSAKIKLIYESTSESFLQNPDQLTVNTWGDLIICEDPVAGDYSRLRGITPAGGVYTIASSDDGEWTGVCFSPDKQTLFVNQQKRGITFAVRGDWQAIRMKAVAIL